MITEINDAIAIDGAFSSVCTFCVHEKDEHRRCKAFGDKDIPLSIWEGKNKHTKPVDGDHGIQFEAREG